MATTYTWSVTQMDCYPEQDGKTDVVFTIHWTLIGQEAGFTGSVYGTAGVTLDPDAPYTPYADITEAQAVGWVQAAMGAVQVTECEANVATQINNQIVPPVVTPPLPWVA